MGSLSCQALASGSRVPGTGECRLQSPHAMGSAQHCSFSSAWLCSWGLGVVSSLFSVSRLETNTPGGNQGFVSSPAGAGETQLQTQLALPWVNRTGIIIPGSRGLLGISRTPLPGISNADLAGFSLLTKGVAVLPAAPQIHPCLPVFNCFHSALLHTNFFLSDLSSMTGWGVFWGTTFRYQAARSEPCAVPPTQSLCCSPCSCSPATAFWDPPNTGSSLVHLQTHWQSSSNSPSFSSDVVLKPHFSFAPFLPCCRVNPSSHSQAAQQPHQLSCSSLPHLPPQLSPPRVCYLYNIS